MSRTHRILVLTPSLPHPPIWGFGIRVYQLVRHLARRHHVEMLAYAREEEADKLRAVREICHAVHTVPPARHQDQGKRAAQAASLLSPRSFQRSCHLSAAMQRALDSLLEPGRFDAVQVESSQLMGFRFPPGVKVLLDEHNIEYELLDRMRQTERAPARRLYNWLEYVKLRREEERAWRDAAGIAFTSTREEEVARALLPGKPTATVPNGVDVDYFRPGDTEPEPGTIVLTGLMRYRPNSDAAVFFVSEVLPHVLARRPDARFVIVGAGPPEEVRRLAGPRVEVTGQVPDVRPYVERAAAVVVPLRMGSGTRLKVLEGFAMGKAIVSTALGCEGIRLTPGEHLLVEDDPGRFAGAVVRVLEDRDLAASLGARGRALAECEYSWPVIGEGLEAFYDRLLAPSPAPAAAAPSSARVGGRR